MSDKLKDKTAALVEVTTSVASDLRDWLQEAKEFSVKQAPEVCRQIVIDRIWEFACEASIGVILALSGSWGMWFSYGKVMVGGKDSEVWWFPFLISGVLVLVGVSLAVYNTLSAIQTKYTAKVVVMDYFKGIINE